MTDDEKKRVLEVYLNSKHSADEVAEIFGISRRCLFNWLRARATSVPGTCATSRPKPRYIDVKKLTKTPKDTQPSDPRDAEIARLKAALAKAELRVEALDTMIDVAEETLRIQIRKKAGAKQ